MNSFETNGQILFHLFFVSILLIDGLCTTDSVRWFFFDIPMVKGVILL